MAAAALEAGIKTNSGYSVWPDDEAVCRTAPATPGLLNSILVWHNGATFRLGTGENTCL